MREWLFTLGPIAAFIYFAIYPHQLMALIDWIGSMTR
jgi:hypothetical protein